MERCQLNQCLAACCYDGTWVDSLKVEEILAQADRILPHIPANYRDPENWFLTDTESDPHLPSGTGIHTAVHPNPMQPYETSCVF
ncbi:MAG: hypothetical protein N2D54_06420 [Chloroflexota bacterium]